MSEPRALRRGVLGPTLFALAGLAVLIGLGVWQLDRKVWKENLIATIGARLSQVPQDLPPRADWPKLAAGADEYRRVTFTAEFLPGQEALVYSAGSALRPDVQGPGYWVFAPARLAGGSIVIVDRGFIPAERKDAASHAAPQGPVDIVGVMRWPEARHWFSPHDDPAHNVWYTRDPAAIAAAKSIGAVAPFYVEQESPLPPGGFPQPGKLVVQPLNNHLQYAITWYGLALVLVVVFVAYAVKSRGEAR